MEEIQVHRASTGPFAEIPQAAIDDVRAGQLSYAALGVLGFLLTLPPDQHVTAEWLASQGPDDAHTTAGALAELEESGYWPATGPVG